MPMFELDKYKFKYQDFIFNKFPIFHFVNVAKTRNVNVLNLTVAFMFRIV